MVLSRIARDAGISRAELARSFGFSEMAATRIVRELLSAHLIEEFELPADALPKKKAVGRPKTGLRIVSQGVFAVGITVSAYHSEVSICDASGELFARSKVKNRSFHRAKDAASFYAKALRTLITKSEVDVDRIVGIGVALSARTNPDRGEIVKSEYFGWSQDDGAFCAEIRKIIDLPIEIENITNALALSEMQFGIARNAAEFALIHVATFVGASIVSDSKVVRGNSDITGLIGHFRSDPQELACVCGRNDCLNLSATGFGLLSSLGKLDHHAFDTDKVPNYAVALLESLGDARAVDQIKETGRNLAPALDMIGKLLGPKKIVISGDLGASPAYFAGLEAELSEEFGQSQDQPFALVKGAITPDRAAALLALHAFCYSDRLDYERFARTTSTGGKAHG